MLAPPKSHWSESYRGGRYPLSKEWIPERGARSAIGFGFELLSFKLGP
jgi:hypothetical protein